MEASAAPAEATAAVTPERRRRASLPHSRIRDAGRIRWGVGEGGRITFDGSPGPGRPHSFAGRGGGAVTGAAAAADRPATPARPHPPAASRGIRTSRARRSRWGAPRPARAIDGRPLASKPTEEASDTGHDGRGGGTTGVDRIGDNHPGIPPSPKLNRRLPRGGVGHGMRRERRRDDRS